MEYYEYYNGFTAPQFLRDNLEIIIQNEAAWYCQSKNKTFIRYCKLRTKSNEMSKRRTGHELNNEEFERKITTLSNPNISRKNRPFIRQRVKVKGKKESRLYTNIVFIQKDNARRRAEKLIQISANERIIPRDRKTESHKGLIASISISDSIGIEVTKKANNVKTPEIKPNPPGAIIWKSKKEN